MPYEPRQPSAPAPFPAGERPLPQSQDAERAVLSCLLQDPGGTMDVAFAALKHEACFRYPPHRRIFICLREMRNEMVADVIDIITVTARLERKGYLEAVGGEDYLNDLLNTVPTTANVEQYVACVLDAYILRQLIRACADITERCYTAEEDTDTLIDGIERQILDVTELRTDIHPSSLRELVRGAITYLNDLSKHDPATMGLATGFRDLDRLITGLKPGELFVLAARPSIGKTAFALNIARNIADGGRCGVAFFSLEMSKEQVVLRLLCSEARINLKDVRDGRLTNAQWATDIMAAGDRLRNAAIFIDDTPQLSTLEMRQKARRLKSDHDIGFIVVDYLQLMRTTGDSRNTSREQQVARLCGEIKALAKELKVPVMILCQLNRQAEQTGGRPKLSHLRESGAIEQDADVVALLHRERETDREQPIPDEDLQRGIETRLIIAKHRNGEVGIVSLAFFGQFTRFENFSRFSEEDIPE